MVKENIFCMFKFFSWLQAVSDISEGEVRSLKTG